jgi:hypothetical protein
VHGQVVDGAGLPISGATVSTGSFSTTTGADGEYRLEGLPKNGSGYTLVANVNGTAYLSDSVKIVPGADVFADIRGAAGTPPPANSIQNGGFEAGSFSSWSFGGNGPRPALSRTQVHTGTYGALLGAATGHEGTGQTDLYQLVQVQLPAGATKATLNFWWWPGSSDIEPFDQQAVKILAGNGTSQLATVFHGTYDDRTWKQTTFDLTPFNGQAVEVLFRVIQDGSDDLTWMYVDDVSVTYS